MKCKFCHKPIDKKDYAILAEWPTYYNKIDNSLTPDAIDRRNTYWNAVNLFTKGELRNKIDFSHDTCMQEKMKEVNKIKNALNEYKIFPYSVLVSSTATTFGWVLISLLVYAVFCIILPIHNLCYAEKNVNCLSDVINFSLWGLILPIGSTIFYLPDAYLRYKLVRKYFK